MDIMKRDPLSTSGWETLDAQLQNKAMMQRMKGDKVRSAGAALHVIFDVLATGTQN